MPIVTQLFKLTGTIEDQRTLEIAGEKIKSGGLVAFPTETVYGLGANALDRDAVNKLFRAKGRPFSDPLIVHICDIEQLGLLILEPPSITWKLVKEFWPGPLTLILGRNSNLPGNVSAEKDSVAVRFPDHLVAQMLIKKSGVPIAAPSANRFMRPSPTTAQHVMDDLAGEVDIILDGGACPIGVESTVVNLLSNPPVILRPGGISLEQLKTFVPGIYVQHNYLNRDGPSMVSPGLLIRHYSPDADLYFVKGDYLNVQNKILLLINKYLKQGKMVGLLIADEDNVLFENLPVIIKQLGPRNDLKRIAANLYSALRDLDSRKVDIILVGDWSHEGLGLAIRDRLIRASGGQVILADI